LGCINSWTQFWRSKAWSDVTRVANRITKQNLANEVSGLAAAWVFEGAFSIAGGLGKCIYSSAALKPL
jgi:hypothetical protein